MPIRSKYSNKEYEALMNDVFAVIEKHNADRDLSIMALGNVLSNIFTHEVTQNDRAAMVELLLPQCIYSPLRSLIHLLALYSC